MSCSLLLMLALQLPPDSDRVLRHSARGKTAQDQSISALVTTRTIHDFFQWAQQRTKLEIVDVWKRAVKAFPPGAAIEGYPNSIGDPTSRRSLQARFMISPQLERDAIKSEDVETVVLFFSDDGLVQRDVVLVVNKVTRKVIGVYQAGHGR